MSVGNLVKINKSEASSFELDKKDNTIFKITNISDKGCSLVVELGENEGKLFGFRVPEEHLSRVA